MGMGDSDARQMQHQVASSKSATGAGAQMLAIALTGNCPDRHMGEDDNTSQHTYHILQCVSAQAAVDCVTACIKCCCERHTCIPALPPSLQRLCCPASLPLGTWTRPTRTHLKVPNQAPQIDARASRTLKYLLTSEEAAGLEPLQYAHVPHRRCARGRVVAHI
eukprot:TRINITY_DN3659_c0_g1_i2.p1 TRINITY_DN3659_c0_g1~~TRINITY_DN3659_c0_g1_i2.p1  ORF type:complete len:163 (+),score=18.17 TRINITY_DN3659_c0_g1_i2:172-660(+)